MTLASEETFQSFVGPDKASALLHGHSYAGNPICCAAALEAIRIFESFHSFDNSTVSMKGGFVESDILELSRVPGVASAMGLGSVIAVELDSDVAGYGSNAAAAVVKLLFKDHIHARPLGNVVYIMVSPVTEQAVIDRVIRVLKRNLTKAFYDPSTSPPEEESSPM